MFNIICTLGSGEKVTIEWAGSAPDIDDLAEFLRTQYPNAKIQMLEDDLLVYPLLDDDVVCEDTRAERRKATARKVNQREALIHSLGKKAGSLYNKRRQKIDRSAGYMRSGNVSRYVETKPTQKTNNRNGYGKSRNPSRRDARYLAMTDFEDE